MGTPSPSACMEIKDGTHVAKIVLMPGDPLRAKYVAETYLEHPVVFNDVRNMLGFTGTYEGREVSVMGSGMGIPVMIVEVVTRIGYAFKRIKEGHSIKEAIPFSLNREKHPKLATMLFIGHSAATAVNAGKVYFTQNPMAINYPQWIAFAKYSYQQLKYMLIEKPNARDAYVRGRINEQLVAVFEETCLTFDEISTDYIVVFE